VLVMSDEYVGLVDVVDVRELVLLSDARRRQLNRANKHVCATSGLPSTPSYLLHNTTRVVARTLLHSTEYRSSTGWSKIFICFLSSVFLLHFRD